MHNIKIYFVTGYVVMLLPYFALLRLILYEEEDQLYHPFQASQAVIKRVSPDLSERAGKIERMSVGYYWYLLGRITFPNI